MFSRVAVVLLVTAALASSAAARTNRALTIKLKSVQTAASAVDKAPKQMAAGKFSPGDILVIRDDLFNRVAQLGRPAGAKVGADRSVLTFASGTAANVVGSASFPGGSLRFKGRVAPGASGTLSMRIMAGSGEFAGARGMVTEPASDSDPTNASNIYHLILP
jgi:dirigent-like protein